MSGARVEGEAVGASCSHLEPDVCGERAGRSSLLGSTQPVRRKRGAAVASVTATGSPDHTSGAPTRFPCKSATTEFANPTRSHALNTTTCNLKRDRSLREAHCLERKTRPAERRRSRRPGLDRELHQRREGRANLAVTGHPDGTEKSRANAHAPARVALLCPPLCKVAAEIPEVAGSGFPGNPRRPGLRTLRAVSSIEYAATTPSCRTGCASCMTRRDHAEPGGSRGSARLCARVAKERWR
jgi:hypothetical protein